MTEEKATPAVQLQQRRIDGAAGHDGVSFKPRSRHGVPGGQAGIDDVAAAVRCLPQQFNGHGRVLAAPHGDQHLGLSFRRDRGVHGPIAGSGPFGAGELHKIVPSIDVVGVEKFPKAVGIELFPPLDLLWGEGAALHPDPGRAGRLPIAYQLHHPQGKDQLVQRFRGRLRRRAAQAGDGPSWMKFRQSGDAEIVGDVQPVLI